MRDPFGARLLPTVTITALLAIHASVGALPPVQTTNTETVRVEADFGTLVVEYEAETLYDPETSELFARPAFLAVDGAGRITVTDFADQTVVGLGPDGSHRFTAGGPGQGPGELEDAWVVAATPSGRIFVHDRFAMRILVFDPDGTFRAALPVEGLGAIDSTSLVALDEDTLLLAAVSVTSPHDRYALHVLDVREASGEPAALDHVDWWVELPDSGMDGTNDLRRHLLAGHATPAGDGGILYSQASPFDVRKLDRHGRTLWRIQDPDAWPHWREFMLELPDGRPHPGLWTRSSGLWPIGDGVYLHLVDEVAEEYDRWQRRDPLRETECGCEPYRRLHEILWVDRGELVRRVRYQAPAYLRFSARDRHGRLYGKNWDTDQLVRVRIRLRFE